MPRYNARRAQIEALGWWILNAVSMGWAPTDEELVTENARGWTLYTAAPMGGTLQHEGVVFTPSELAQAKAYAERFYAEELAQGI